MCGKPGIEKGGTVVGGLSTVKKRDRSASGTFVAGLLVVAPIYLSVLLLLLLRGFAVPTVQRCRVDLAKGRS